MQQREEPFEAADAEACRDSTGTLRTAASKASSRHPNSPEHPVGDVRESEQEPRSAAAFDIDDGVRSNGKAPKGRKKARRYQHVVDDDEGIKREESAAELEAKTTPIPKSAAPKKLGWKAWAALIIFFFQTAFAGILVRYTKAFQASPYSSQAAVLMQEIVKIPASMLLLAFETGGAYSMVMAVVDDLRSHPMEWVKMTVPAIVYTAQMNFQYVGYENVPVAIGQITYQSKVLFTALCSVLMLKKQLSANQWISQACLLLGVIVVQAQNFSGEQATGKEGQLPLLGTIAFLAAAASSAFASVFLEKMLKSDRKPSLWLRNIQLAVYGSTAAAINVAIARDPLIASDGLCYGMDGVVWFSIIWQAGGGLLVALTIKYADNILKCFAQAGAIILVATISHFTVGFGITPLFAAGAVLVVTSIFLYGEQTKTPCELCEANRPKRRQALDEETAQMQEARKKYTRCACVAIFGAAAASITLIYVPSAALLIGTPPPYMPPAPPAMPPSDAAVSSTGAVEANSSERRAQTSPPPFIPPATPAMPPSAAPVSPNGAVKANSSEHRAHPSATNSSQLANAEAPLNASASVEIGTTMPVHCPPSSPPSPPLQCPLHCPPLSPLLHCPPPAAAPPALCPPAHCPPAAPVIDASVSPLVAPSPSPSSPPVPLSPSPTSPPSSSSSLPPPLAPQPPSWHLAPAGMTECDSGHTPTQAECDAAGVMVRASSGMTTNRAMQVGAGGFCNDGSWGAVPNGCSLETGGDWASHYKTTGPNCPSSGGTFRLICSGSASVQYDPLGAACQRATTVDPVIPIFELCFNKLRAVLPNGGSQCTGDVLVTVSFYNGRAGSERPAFPSMPASAPPIGCRFAFVDQSYTSGGPSGNADAWTVVVMDQRCFADDQRAAHFLKAALPLVLPSAAQIFYGDLKCITGSNYANAQNPAGSFPIEAMRPPAGQHLTALEHPWWAGNTVDFEFTATVGHLHERGDANQPPGTFSDITTQHEMYVREGYDMSLPNTVPDTMCLGWRNTAASKTFSCRWSLEIALYSMREQLNFDHALRLSPINIHWISFEQAGVADW